MSPTFIFELVWQQTWNIQRMTNITEILDSILLLFLMCCKMRVYKQQPCPCGRRKENDRDDK